MKGTTLKFYLVLHNKRDEILSPKSLARQVFALI